MRHIRGKRWGAVGVVVLIFGMLCLNYTKAGSLERHRAVAQRQGLPEPGAPIFYGGVLAVIAGSGLIGHVIGNRTN